MVTWLGDVHFWSLKNQTQFSDDNIGCFTYHEKSDTGSFEHYLEEKTHYTESRDVTWTLKNKKPEKLRDTLKEVEDLLLAHRCILCKWLSRKVVQTVLANGIIISFLVSLHTGDVDSILIDRSFVGRLSTDSASDVVMTDAFYIFSHSEKAILDFVHFTKKPVSATKRLEKLSIFEPRISSVEIPGPIGRRLERKLCMSFRQDLVISWWSAAQEEAWPWSPTTGERERANMVLLSVQRQKLELVSFTRSDSEPIGVSFSSVCPERILCVEQATSSTNQLSAKLAVYECQHTNKIQRTSVVTIPLKGKLLCCERNDTEDKVVLGCHDNSLVLYDELKCSTHHTTTAFVPHTIRWHPSGTVLMVADLKGQIQVFDQALNALLFELVAENSSPQKSLNLMLYFKSSLHLVDAQWNLQLDSMASVLADCNDSIFLLFNRGPLVLVQYYMGVMTQGQLTPLSLVYQYIKYRQLNESIRLLASLNWNAEGETCMASITAIVNHLLANTLDAQREAYLERALATFYAPAKPLNESCIVAYRDAMSHLARRFFHHLLRFTRFDKAYLLAVDIGARDLFMDIHYIAKDKGEGALAEVAIRKAQEVEAEALGSDMLDGNFSENEDDEDEDFYHSTDDDHDDEDTTRHLPSFNTTQTVGHPIQLVTRNNEMMSQLPTGNTPQQRYMDLSEISLRELEATLANQMIDDYSRKLMEDPILPPPASHADDATDVQEGDYTSSSVRVINFGMV